MNVSLFSPHTRRPVTFKCSGCGATHSTDVPASWSDKRRTIWTLCPDTGIAISATLERAA